MRDFFHFSFINPILQYLAQYLAYGRCLINILVKIDSIGNCRGFT